MESEGINMTKDNKSKLLVILAFPFFFSFFIYDIKDIEFWYYNGFTLVLFLTIFNLVAIKVFYPRTSFVIGVIIWTTLCALLYNDTFVVIGISLFSLLTILTFVFMYQRPKGLNNEN